MRTTLSIDDELLATAKQRARETGVSLGAIVDDALRRELSRERPDGPPIPVFHGGTGLRPGVDLTSNRAVRELLDEGRAPDSLR